MIIGLKTAKDHYAAHAAARKRFRYIITIDEQETPGYVARELNSGVITVMINARTMEEAERLRKQNGTFYNRKKNL